MKDQEGEEEEKCNKMLNSKTKDSSCWLQLTFYYYSPHFKRTKLVARCRKYNLNLS